MKSVLDGWVPPTALEIGLAKTISWYRASKAQADAKW
jgi:GDP-L-fucose synthase